MSHCVSCIIVRERSHHAAPAAVLCTCLLTPRSLHPLLANGDSTLADRPSTRTTMTANKSSVSYVQQVGHRGAALSVLALSRQHLCTTFARMNEGRRPSLLRTWVRRRSHKESHQLRHALLVSTSNSCARGQCITPTRGDPITSEHARSWVRALRSNRVQ